MRICIGYQNADMNVSQCSVNTVNAVRHDVFSCNGEYEAVARKKSQRRRPGYGHAPEFIQQHVLRLNSDSYVKMLEIVVLP